MAGTTFEPNPTVEWEIWFGFIGELLYNGDHMICSQTTRISLAERVASIWLAPVGEMHDNLGCAVVRAAVGLSPFVIAAYEFGKRIVRPSIKVTKTLINHIPTVTRNSIAQSKLHK